MCKVNGTLINTGELAGNKFYYYHFVFIAIVISLWFYVFDILEEILHSNSSIDFVLISEFRNEVFSPKDIQQHDREKSPIHLLMNYSSTKVAGRLSVRSD